MEQDQKEYTKRIMNKIHLITFFIVKCEAEDPLEESDEKWHPDFEKAIQCILLVNEQGKLEEDDLHEFNDLYRKWSNRFERLGLSDRPIEEWENSLEPEVFQFFKKHYHDKS